MLILYHTPGSSSFATHIALHEAGAEFESRPIPIGQGGTRDADYLAVNPAGKVPALVVDGNPLTEVAATLFFIARQYPNAQLFPTAQDIEGQAQVISWMSFVASAIHPVWSQGPDKALPVFKIADNRLGERQWAVRDTYSIADIHLFRLYWRFTGRFDVKVDALPNLKRHHDQVMKRPAVQKTIEIENAAKMTLP